MSQSHATYIESHIMRRFSILKKVGSGAYGHVWKVEEKTTKKVMALKKIFDAFQHATDAQRTYREIEILKQLAHPNIIKLHDTIRADNNKDVYLVFEFMEADLHNVISEGILKEVHIKFIIYQMAKALKYMHSAAIIHRDLKPSNVLVNSNCTIKLCDFGLVRSLNKHNESHAVLTEGVATRWYRAPEVLLGSKNYSTPADVWSFGCIIYEILAQKPLFPGNSTLDQLEKICLFTGYPTEEDISSLESEVAKSMVKEIKVPPNSRSTNFLKDFSAPFGDMLEKMLSFNPKKRMTIDELLAHEVVKAFHKPEEEISCEKLITTAIDDNKKYSVEEYRKLVYGLSSNAPTVTTKTKALSASVGAGSASAKYLHSGINKTSVQVSSSSVHNAVNRTTVVDKTELSKKYSHEKFRTTTTVQNYSKHEVDRKYERPVLKYVKSAKDMTRNIENIAQPRRPESKVEGEEGKVEGKRESQSSYLVNRSSGYGVRDNKEATNTSGSWKALKNNVSSVYSPKDIKEKAALYKSPKYISINKNEPLAKTGIAKHEAKPGH